MTTLLLLIDAQRAFCDPDGSMAQQARSIAPMAEAARACGCLAAAARAAGVPVAWTRMVFRPDYSDGGRLINELRPNLKRIGALRAGTPDVELSARAGAEPGDIVIDKTRYSALIGTELETVLAERGITRILVGGVTTSMCVETTVRDLSQRDYDWWSYARPAATSRPTATRPRFRPWISASPPWSRLNRRWRASAPDRLQNGPPHERAASRRADRRRNRDQPRRH